MTSTFEGFRRPDGRVGVRNHVLVLSATGLTSAAAQRIAQLVRGAICVTTGYGRGQVGDDARLQVATLSGLVAHPNVAAALVVSAAGDITSLYVDAARAAGKPVVGLSLPDVREDALALVDAGVRHAARLVREASLLRREACPASELVVAVECGHSDATSGLVCNPLAGRMMELVVEAGGTAMFSETVEWTGADLLAQRASSEVARKIMIAVGERERAVRESGGDLRAQNPGPQNKAGGITTLRGEGARRHRQGRTAADPRRPRARATPPGRGLYLMDTPFFSPESITAMVASGAQLVCFTTGAGNSYCSLVAPTIKMSAHPATCERLTEQIDLGASAVLDGTATLESAAQTGFAKLLDVASGSLTFGEIVGEGAEVVSRLGPST